MNANARRLRSAATQGGLTHALLYVRVSGAEHQREGLSLAAQESATRRYVSEQSGWAIAGEYRDIESGAHDDRREYQALLSEARRLYATGQRAAVVTVRLDRLGRHLLEQVRAREELKKLGCETHSIKEGGQMSDLHAHILMSVAQAEREKVGERVAEVRSHVVMSGWAYGRVAFGYRLRPATVAERAAGSPKNVLETDPATRGVVAECFARAANGESVRSVARWAASLPASSRGEWGGQYSSVCRLLRSPTYAARPTEGVDDVLSRPLARWEALVSDTTWATVQARLDGHAVHPHQASGRFLLTGLIRCSVCGNRAVATSTCADGRKRLYRCTGAGRGANATIADCTHGVSLPSADAAVLEQVAAVLDTWAAPNMRPGLLAAWQRLNAPTADVSSLVAALERDLAKAQKRLGDAAGLLVDGALDRAGYEALRDRETAAISAAEAERARLSATVLAGSVQRLPSAQNLFESAGSWGAMLAGVDVPAQREIVATLIERVTVSRKPRSRRYVASVGWSPLGAKLYDAARTAQADA